MKKSYILISFIFVLLIIQTVHAISGSIKPPRMILRENVSVNQITLIPSSIEISNPNNFAINVTMSGSDIIQIDTIPFNLNSGQSRTVDFDILIPAPGNYSGDVSAVFSSSGKIPVALSSEVIVYAEEGEVSSNTYSPTKPILLNPENGDSNHENQIDLVWNPSSDADGDSIIYYYDVDNNKDFSSPQFHGLTSGTQRSIVVIYGVTYFWKITAFDGQHNVSSDIWNFTASNTAPTVPVLIEPLNDESLVEEPVLVWEDSDDADGDSVTYDILIDNNADFSSPVINETESSTTFDTLGRLPSEEYYWKVRSKDGITNSAYSTSWTFNLILPVVTTTTSPTTTPTTSPSSSGGGGSSGGSSGGSGSTKTTLTTTIDSTTTIQSEQQEQNNNQSSAELNNQTESDQATGKATGGSSSGIIIIIILVVIGGIIFYLRRPTSYGI